MGSCYRCGTSGPSCGGGAQNDLTLNGHIINIVTTSSILPYRQLDHTSVMNASPNSFSCCTSSGERGWTMERRATYSPFASWLFAGRPGRHLVEAWASLASRVHSWQHQIFCQTISDENGKDPFNTRLPSLHLWSYRTSLVSASSSQSIIAR